MFKVTTSLHFVSLNSCCYAPAAVENKDCGSVHYITIGASRLRTVASATGLRDAESTIFNSGRSVASWTFFFFFQYCAGQRFIAALSGRYYLCTGRIFHPAQRPVERALA